MSLNAVTGREPQVLTLIGQGATNARIVDPGGAGRGCRWVVIPRAAPEGGSPLVSDER